MAAVTNPPPGAHGMAEAFALARRLLAGAGFIDRDTIAPPRLRRDLHAPTPQEAQAYAMGGPDRLIVALARRIDDAAALEEALAGMAFDRWGYDVNILGSAPEVARVEELHLWLLAQDAPVAARLAAMGFAAIQGGFSQGYEVPRFPDLPPGLDAPVFPVPTTPAGADPFATPGQSILGYACPAPPPGAIIEATVRGFAIVQAGVPFRSIRKLRVVVPIMLGDGPQATARRLRDAVALAHVLPEPRGS
jgi:hypothetical protein